MTTEKVLCLPARALPDASPNVITGFPAFRTIALLVPHGFFVPREKVEEDLNFRQVIPYCVVQNADDGRIVRMVRKPKQSEARLHGKIYIGAGGHVNEGDLRGQKLINPASDPIGNAAIRELDEELGIGNGVYFFEGMIISNASAVQCAHIGMLFRFITRKTRFAGEKDSHDAQWRTKDELMLDVPSMEAWSQIALRHILDNA